MIFLSSLLIVFEGEGAPEDATIRFDFRASIPATPSPGRGTEDRTSKGGEDRRVELKKINLLPEKYDGKVDFEGWVNQFEKYATLGQWSDTERALLLFLSLTGVKALRRRF